MPDSASPPAPGPHADRHAGSYAAPHPSAGPTVDDPAQRQGLALTGHPGVDAALHLVATVEDLDLDAHAEVYEAARQRLGAALDGEDTLI